jgi:hypothetical protein
MIRIEAASRWDAMALTQRLAAITGSSIDREHEQWDVYLSEEETHHELPHDLRNRLDAWVKERRIDAAIVNSEHQEIRRWKQPSWWITPALKIGPYPGTAPAATIGSSLMRFTVNSVAPAYPKLLPTWLVEDNTATPARSAPSAPSDSKHTLRWRRRLDRSRRRGGRCRPRRSSRRVEPR